MHRGTLLSSTLYSGYKKHRDIEILPPLPQTTLVLGHSGEHVAIESVEVVMVGHIMGDHLCINDVALVLLARLVQSLNTQQHVVRCNFLLSVIQARTPHSTHLNTLI